ncbi:GntR family transcriptional regulator [Saccharopolyspora hordei]|uniref:GntR family transcriptional regulator n=1 Tax=Saccharopolyspora hordei TaxID=1838 RepID=A0A853AK83_9PSEU|nr:GntR family transcriptional regulator [Saccharopolyspora hordei]NYI84196.1 GntR family transcriptional regulator [Saccharopolyspora hordei]
MTAEAIDRQSTTPYYQQLVAVLEQRIAKGSIPLGDRLPSENELCAEFGLSRATVRQALQLMESRGLVTRVPNRGVYASEPTGEGGWGIQGPEGFLENAIGHQNRSVQTEVLRHGPVILPAHVCRALQVPTDSAGFELVRLRSLDGVPALYSINYSPSDLVPVIAGAKDVLAGQASLSELLSSAGYALGGAHRAIRAVSPSPEIAEALQVSESEPILHIRSTSWTPAGKRFDIYDTWVCSDVIPLEVNVSVTGAK